MSRSYRTSSSGRYHPKSGVCEELTVPYTPQQLLREAAFDRALADPAWLGERLSEVERGVIRRAKEWGQKAMVRADLHVRWIVAVDKAAALSAERECQRLLAGTGLWNRRA